LCLCAHVIDFHFEWIKTKRKAGEWGNARAYSATTSAFFEKSTTTKKIQAKFEN